MANLHRRNPPNQLGRPTSAGACRYCGKGEQFDQALYACGNRCGSYFHVACHRHIPSNRLWLCRHCSRQGKTKSRHDQELSATSHSSRPSVYSNYHSGKSASTGASSVTSGRKMDHEEPPLQPQPRFGTQCRYPGCSAAVLFMDRYCAQHAAPDPPQQAGGYWRQPTTDDQPRASPSSRSDSTMPGLPVNSRLGEEFFHRSQRTAKKVAQNPGIQNIPRGLTPFSRSSTPQVPNSHLLYTKSDAYNPVPLPNHHGVQWPPSGGLSRKRPVPGQDNPPPRPPIFRPYLPPILSIAPKPLSPDRDHRPRVEASRLESTISLPPLRDHSALPHEGHTSSLPHLNSWIIEDPRNAGFPRRNTFEPPPPKQSPLQTFRTNLESRAESWYARQEIEKQQRLRQPSESSESQRGTRPQQTPHRLVSVKRVPDGLPVHVRDALEEQLVSSMAAPPPRHAATQRPANGHTTTAHSPFAHTASSRAHREKERIRQVTAAAIRRERLAAAFDQTAFDAEVYAQGRDATSPAPQQPAADRLPEESDRLHLALDPRIHWPLRWTEEWYDAKMAEIRARGGRKAQFGRAAQRRRDLRRQAEARMRADKAALALGQPLRRHPPAPWTHSRPVDFGDVAESELPDYVKANPSWLRACEWMRSNRAQVVHMAQQKMRRKAAGETIQNLLGQGREPVAPGAVTNGRAASPNGRA
ncbi:hypothetical protein EV126DRAFT_12849 [Verticillium dahliae]|nr:hypothetical protein EV126DRAFT_12849 [Verticillium dahliae]